MLKQLGMNSIWKRGSRLKLKDERKKLGRILKRVFTSELREQSSLEPMNINRLEFFFFSVLASLDSRSKSKLARKAQD